MQCNAFLALGASWKERDADERLTRVVQPHHARIESRRQLLRSVGNEFEFDHLQILEVILSELPKDVAQKHHASIARRLEARLTSSGAEVAGADAVQICRQLFLAGEAADAAVYLDNARRHLVSNGQNEAEIELLNAALRSEGLLSGCRRIALLLAKASNLGFVGRPAEQGLVLRDAEALAAEGSCDQAQCRVLAALGGFLLRAGRFDAAQHVLV